MSTVKTAGSWTPDYAVLPGDVLAEHLEARGWTQAELARRCGKSPKLISEIISGKNPIEPDTALALERVLGMKAEIWNGIEADWRLFKAKEADRQEANRHIAWVSSFPLASLRKRLIVPDIRDTGDARDKLLAFFGVGSETAYAARWQSSTVAYRHSKTKASSPELLRVWLRLGELEAEKVSSPPFDHDRLVSLMPKLRSLTLFEPDHYVPAARELCLSAGVLLAIVAPVENAALSGAAYHLADGRAVAQLSMRHRSNDHFWFTLFHELGHLVLHKKAVVFVDDHRADGGEDKHEAEADGFAEDKLVGRARLRSLCDQNSRSRAVVVASAKTFGVHPGVLVGMLQHRGSVPWQNLNGLKQKIDVDRFASVP